MLAASPERIRFSTGLQSDSGYGKCAAVRELGTDTDSLQHGPCILKRAAGPSRRTRCRRELCVWVMRVDGLHVGPFTHHPDGDRSLRDAGLTAEGWVQWVTRIIAHDQQVRTSDITALRPGRKEEFERASDAVGRGKDLRQSDRNCRVFGLITSVKPRRGARGTSRRSGSTTGWGSTRRRTGKCGQP